MPRSVDWSFSPCIKRTLSLWLRLLFSLWECVTVGLLPVKIQVILGSPWLANIWPWVNYDWHWRGELCERIIYFHIRCLKWQSCASFSSLCMYPVLLSLNHSPNCHLHALFHISLLCLVPSMHIFSSFLFFKKKIKANSFIERIYCKASNISLTAPNILFFFEDD